MIESIKHNACLLKKGRGKWEVLGNCRSIKLWFLEKSERSNSTMCKQLGHNTEMRNSQSSFAGNKWHPISHISFCKCSKRNYKNSEVLCRVGQLLTVSYNNLGRKEYPEYIFPVGVKQERQK